MAGASGCNAFMDRDEAAVAATGLLAKLIMPEDKVTMKEIWKDVPHSFKDLKLANDSFESEPEKRAGAAAVFRNTKRVRTMKVDVKRLHDERFATWQRRIEVRREQKAVFERENGKMIKCTFACGSNCCALCIATVGNAQTWLILPVIICLSQ